MIRKHMTTRNTNPYIYEETSGEYEGLTKSYRTIGGAIDYGNTRLRQKATAMRVGTPYPLSKVTGGTPSKSLVLVEWRSNYDRTVLGVVWR
jgi:hypothetical protein